MKYCGFVQGPTFKDIVGPVRTRKESYFSIPNRDFRYLGSGKAAIAAILSYLRHVGFLTNKMSGVLVPSWLGVQVYHAITSLAFPKLSPDDSTRVMFAYHQYGFPQDMDRIQDFVEDRKMLLVEDCAHAVESFYHGRRVGSFGDFAIFSFSKFTFCYTLGGAASNDQSFVSYIDEHLKKGSKFLRGCLNLVKLIDEANLARKRPLVPGLFGKLRNMAYAAYGESPLAAPRAVRMWEAKQSSEIAKRKERYSHFRERTDDMGICDHLESDGVVPWVIPIRVDGAKAETLVSRLREASIETGQYRFDVDRFSVEPNFQNCVCVPCHGDMSDNRFSQIINIVRQTL